MYPDSTIKRFWNKVDIGLPDQCWEWTASRKEKGYGQFNHGRSHRFAWEITHGSIPSGMLCLHKCDNPGCCNPRHLYLGTALQNSADMKRRNPDHRRNVTRAHRKASPLNWAAVRDIRSSDLSQRALAKKYSVSRRCIRSVLDNRSWSS